MNKEETEKDQQPTLEERVKSATVGSYRNVLDDIKELDSDIEKEIYIGKLATTLKVNKASLMKEIKIDESSENVVKKAVFPELIDLVQDHKGNVGYLVKHDGNVGYAETWEGPSGETYIPPERNKLPFTLGNSKKIQDYYGNGIETEELFDDLGTYFKRFSYLPDNVWPLIIFSVFLSYLHDHKDVWYNPTIYFYAVAERGKSRTAKSMLSVSHRGIHLVDLKSANIFRYAENLKATLFFDCTDLWKSAEKSDCADILLSRFEKGPKISRVLYPDRGAFDDQVQYDIYGSTVVATNEPANVTFESRCLTITMPNKPGEYENMTPEMGVELKERLTAWRAWMMGARLPEIQKVEGVNGRLWDITKPLFQLCELIKPDVRESMIQVLLEMVGQKAEDKKESLEGRLVAAIDSLADFDGESEVEIEVADIREVYNRGKLDRYHINSQKLGKRIKSLSLSTRIVRGYSRLTVSQKELNILKEQYGLLTPAIVPDADSQENDSVERVVESGRESLDADLPKEPQPKPWSRDQKDKKPADNRIQWG